METLDYLFQLRGNVVSGVASGPRARMALETTVSPATTSAAEDAHGRPRSNVVHLSNTISSVITAIHVDEARLQHNARRKVLRQALLSSMNTEHFYRLQNITFTGRTRWPSRMLARSMHTLSMQNIGAEQGHRDVYALQNSTRFHHVASPVRLAEANPA